MDLNFNLHKLDGEAATGKAHVEGAALAARRTLKADDAAAVEAAAMEAATAP